ncbi:hypothetical protein ABK040_014201 [Willaertia magna]
MPNQPSDKNKRRNFYRGNKKSKKKEKKVAATVVEAVSPLAHLEYDAQLKLKENESIENLKDMCERIREKWKENIPTYLKEERYSEENLKGLSLDWKGILPSPVTEGYRNNCEFSIGYNSKEEPSVGFRQGSFVQGSVNIESPEEVRIISDGQKKAVKILQALVQETAEKYKCYNMRTHEGTWRILKARENLKGELLLMVQIHPQNISPEEMKSLKERIIEQFKAHDKNHQSTSELAINIKGLFLQVYDGVNNAAPTDLPIEVLYGEDNIVEEVLGLKFKISPLSFFQVNIKGVEVLYSKVREWALENISINENNEEKKKRVLLDVCSGTGTIGQILSSSVDQVIGIEMVESSVNDAINNAKLNNIENITFICGKAEDTIATNMSKYELNSPNVECIAVVDPPRSGLHKKVLHSILRSPTIERLIYVSCNPSTLAENAVELCAPPSKNSDFKPPFVPVKAVAVDMFPHTEHREMICVFERKLSKQ